MLALVVVVVVVVLVWCGVDCGGVGGGGVRSSRDGCVGQATGVVL